MGEGQVAEFIEDDEVLAAEIVGHASLPAGASLGLELIDQIDDVEEAAAGAVADEEGESPVMGVEHHLLG